MEAMSCIFIQSLHCPCTVTDINSRQGVGFFSVDALDTDVSINVAKVGLACWLSQMERVQKLDD